MGAKRLLNLTKLWTRCTEIPVSRAANTKAMSSAGVMIDLKDAVGTELGDCLIFQEKGKEVRKLDDFSTSHANPAQLVLGFSYQVPPLPYPTPPAPP